MASGRLLALGAVALILGLGLGIRAVSDGGVAQHSGTALYAALIYAGLFALWPRLSSIRAGLLAVGFCWAVEFFQLTGIPAALSERSLPARLVLGASFDWADVGWYPVGVIPLVAVHLLARARRAAPG